MSVRYGEHTKNKGLETHFTTTNLEQIGIKQHNYMLKKGEHNALEKVRSFSKINLNLCTDIPPCSYSEVDSKGKKK